MKAFVDRLEAGKKLARELVALRGQHPLILAIPRGGVVLGACLAEDLRGDLDVVLVRKIGAPGEPEYALGAVGEEGDAVWNQEGQDLEGDADWRREAVAQERRILAQRRKLYTPKRAPLPVKGRLTVVVDDGIATGATMLAALRQVRRQGPARLIAAAAVGAPQNLPELAAEADQLTVLEAPEAFVSVSQFYEDFPQLSDAEVIASLQRAQKYGASN